MSEIARDLLTPPSQPKAAKTIADRLSQELIIGLVGPIGSGVSIAASYINDILTQDFGYTVCPIIKMSDFIRAESHRVGNTSAPRSPLDAYVTAMQDAGNLLRARFGGDYLAEKAVERICKFRKADNGYSDLGVPLPGRRAYIIDSLKNTEELDLLRQIYGETLCVFGIFAPDSIRTRRLSDIGTPQASIKKIIDRDQGEDATFGQKTRKLFVESDFFVCNDKKKEELRTKIARFLDLMFDTTIHTPTRAESAMYEASSVAAKSACMSRQVGAAIVSEKDELIAVGWNRHSLANATLYTNTYPCHNCARHIVASGITSVVYIEPYLKSLAIELHSDAVTEDPDDKTRVVFRQYDGVAPRNYLRLFKPLAMRKKDGQLTRPPRKAAVPVLRVQLDAQTDYEAKVIAELSNKEESDNVQ